MNLLQLNIDAAETYRQVLKKMDDPIITDDIINSNQECCITQISDL